SALWMTSRSRPAASSGMRARWWPRITNRSLPPRRMVSLLEPLELDGDSRPRLFVHCASTPQASERALVLARPQDIVCVADEVDPAYLAYLAELGLGPAPERVVAMSRFGDHAPNRALWARLAGSTEALRTLGGLLRETGPLGLHPFIAT